MTEIGTLYVVATPIGNLGDMTMRAVETLKGVDKIVAEDTRHSAFLLKHFSIQKPTVSLHNFNEKTRQQVIIEYLLQGESIALISDAGTPLISDPGFSLIRKAREQNIKVVPIPGVCAAIAALCAAGLPTDQFIFAGFLPAKQEARKKSLKLLIHETRTLIFYEAPHRLLETLHDMCDLFGGQREGVVARELTKIHESILGMNLEKLLQHFQCHADEVRGEIVILVQGIDQVQNEIKEVKPAEVLSILLDELPLKQAVSLASKITGQRKNSLYELALKRKDTD